MRKYSYVTFIILFLLAYILLYQFFYSNRIKDYLSERTREIELTYSSVLETYKIPAKVYFSSVINTPEILSIVYNAYHGNSSTKNEMRDSLFTLLNHVYTELKELNFRQLHFHFKNNESFLRFHKPEKFGDNLTDIRSTIKYTNEHVQYVQGFEEGRIFNGFRYVFPLVYNKEHIGSVEISIEYRGIVKSMEKNHHIVGDFMIQKQHVESKVFESEKINYYESPYSPEFVMEMMALARMREKKLDHIAYEELVEATKAEKRITNSIKQFEAISFPLKSLEIPVIATFLPVFNFDGQKVAYLIIYQIDNYYSYLQKNFLIAGVVGFIFMMIIFLFIVAINYSKEKLIRKNEEINLLAQEINKKNEALLNSESNLKVTNEQLININKTKDQFFSIIAHDLKNPFHVILGLSKILIRHLTENNNNKDTELASAINQSALQAYNLLENLLQWAAAQTGKINYKNDRIPLNIIISKVIEFTKPNAESKKINLINEIKETVFVKADANLLETVLRNLITNAIKFTPENGQIFLKLEISQLAKICISDNGVGMSEETMNQLFINPGKQISKGTKGESGSGLGLTLCKDFVELMNGKIEVTSELGRGSQFCISLPVSF